MTLDDIEDAGVIACRLNGWRWKRGLTLADRGQLFVGSSYAGRYDDDTVVFDRDRDQVLVVPIGLLAYEA